MPLHPSGVSHMIQPMIPTIAMVSLVCFLAKNLSYLISIFKRDDLLMEGETTPAALQQM